MMILHSLGLTAGCRCWPLPSQPTKITVSSAAGTALTIDLAQGQKHLGGYILPNLYLQRDSLIQNTKGIKIPDAAFEELSPGRNTIDAVHHGILFGLLSTIEKYCKIFRHS